MKRVFSIILILSMMSMLVACDDGEDKLYGLYKSDDNVVNTDIGNFIVGNKAPLFTEGRMLFYMESDERTDENLSCKSALVVDCTDNKLLFAENSFKQVYPASITRLLTALLILKNGNPDDIVTIKEDNCGITEKGAVLVGLKQGDKITVKDLLYCLLEFAGNDSGIALAEYHSGSTEVFCTKLNEEAKRLGLTGTYYLNPNGLHDKNHYTTAYDTYIVLQECMKYQLFKDICKITNYDFVYSDSAGTDKNKHFTTTNKYKNGTYKLPKNIKIIGGKTGSTAAAGSCLVLDVIRTDTKIVDDEEVKTEHEYYLSIFGAQNSQSLYEQMTYLLTKYVNNDSTYDKEEDKEEKEDKD